MSEKVIPFEVFKKRRGIDETGDAVEISQEPQNTGEVVPDEKADHGQIAEIIPLQGVKPRIDAFRGLLDEENSGMRDRIIFIRRLTKSQFNRKIASERANDAKNLSDDELREKILGAEEVDIKKHPAYYNGLCDEFLRRRMKK